jgi:hypothetical protein
MNRAKLRREGVALARYVNHYAHIPNVTIGGWAAARKMSYGRVRGEYYHVRRQQKRRFLSGYSQVVEIVFAREGKVEGAK